MRPMLGGKSVPIPNSNLKQKGMINKVKGKIRENRENKEKPTIKLLENIKIKPPRREVKIQQKVEDKTERRIEDRTEDRDNIEEVTNMEWEENGISWNEEKEAGT